MKSLVSDLSSTLGMVLVATLILALGFFIPTGPAQAQGSGDETVGTVPIVEREAITVTDASPSEAALAATPNGHWEVSWISGGGKVVVSADQQPGEDDSHFAHRCALKRNAFRVEFPPDQ